MENRKTALLLPSAYRAPILNECLTSLFVNTPNLVCDTFVSIFLDDRDSMDVVQEYDIAGLVYRDREEYELGAIHGWGRLLKQYPDYPFYIIAADDLIFHKGWYEAASSAMRDMRDYGLVGFNDLHSDGDEYAAHFMVSRDFLIDHHGGVIYPPMYRSWWCDREITDLAKLHKCYTFAKDAIVEHRNHAWNGIKYDETYRDASRNYEADRIIYEERKAKGFPIDWPPVVRHG